MNQCVVFHTLSAPEREGGDIQVQLVTIRLGPKRPKIIKMQLPENGPNGAEVAFQCAKTRGAFSHSARTAWAQR